VRLILCQIDDLGETFTFQECTNPAAPAGPYFANVVQATSVEGAKQLLGQIANNVNINGV
jgi:hypothetical protein